MSGPAKSDSGGIVIDGIDTIAAPNYARQACSFQAQTQLPISGLTAKQAMARCAFGLMVTAQLVRRRR